MNFSNLPPVTMRLIIINALVFVFTYFISPDLLGTFALYYFESPKFEAYQLISHMFTHGGIGHIFFNMFALFMFGSVLERVWGAKRFLIFYFVTGFGAVILHQFVDYMQIQNALAALPHELQSGIAHYGFDAWLESNSNNVPAEYYDEVRTIASSMYTPVVGASGAVFGLLAGFAMLFPNTELMLIFLPVPIKAKYFVLIYAAFELFSGISTLSGNGIQGDNIAHFAHLGGALFGFILVKVWNKDRDTFY